jgi:hypothetical protein
MRGYISSILAGALLISQSALQRRATVHESPKTDAAAAASVIVPPGTVIPLELKNTVNSRTAYVEQAIYAETIFPVVVGERIVIPVHSYVRGEVTEVVRPGRVSGKAMLGLRCNLIILPSGVSRPITARVSSLGGSRIQAATTNASSNQSDSAGTDDSTLVDASVISQPSAIVDASGIVDPSISGAAEGVGGLVMTLATRGRTIVLRPGTTFELQLTQPLDLKGSVDGASKPTR